MSDAFANSPAPLRNKLDNFEKYVRRQALSRFLVKYELFKLQLGIKGSIVECGVHHGGGLLGWAKLSSAMEPYALDRRVIGFDTFEGFPSVAAADSGAEANAHLKTGGFDTGYDVYSELTAVIKEHDENRFLNQFEKVQLVRGDACQTIPEFVAKNPHLLVSLLYLDFDLHDPTKVALEHLFPRMPKGAVLAFDEVNNPWWPGETQAMLGALDLKKYQLQRFSMDPNISYIVL